MSKNVNELEVEDNSFSSPINSTSSTTPPEIPTSKKNNILKNLNSILTKKRERKIESDEEEEKTRPKRQTKKTYLKYIFSKIYLRNKTYKRYQFLSIIVYMLDIFISIASPKIFLNPFIILFSIAMLSSSIYCYDIYKDINNQNKEKILLNSENKKFIDKVIKVNYFIIGGFYSSVYYIFFVKIIYNVEVYIYCWRAGLKVALMNIMLFIFYVVVNTFFPTNTIIKLLKVKEAVDELDNRKSE